MTLLPSPKFKKKTDNQSLADKCALRRLLIEESGLEPLRVLDLYAGEGTLWRELRREPHTPDEPRAIEVQTYLPVDSAAKQTGQLRMKINTRLIAAMNGDKALDSYDGDGLARFNTIDVDPYGDPFEVWSALLFRIKTPTLVFLTRGRVTYGAGRMPFTQHSKKVLGIPLEWDVPCRIELLDFADRAQVLQSCPTAKLEKGYWIRGPRADYYALKVIPKEAQEEQRGS